MGQIMRLCLKDYVSFLREKKPTLGALQLGPAPYRVKIKIVKTQGLLYAKEQARHTVSTQKKINQTEPSSSRYGQKRDVWFAPNQTVTFLLISQAGVVGLNYPFLR